VKDSYLAQGVTAAQAGSLFNTARELWAAAPWNIILSADSLIRVSCVSLALDNAVISVVGQHREMFGFLLFPAGLDAYAEFEKTSGRGIPPKQPFVSFAFVSRHDLSVHLRREVEKFGWPLVTESLYPLVTTVDARGPRQASSSEVDRVEAVASALCELVRTEPNLEGVTFGIGSFEHTLEVTTATGRHELRLSAPCIPPADDDGDGLVFVRPATTASKRRRR